MSAPERLHSIEYYQELRDLRDQALVNSNLYGVRKKIGSFVFGYASARWRTEDNARAFLREEGIRFRDVTLTRIYPTTLDIFRSYGRNSTELTTYKMDIDDIGTINVYRTMLTENLLNDAFLSVINRPFEDKNDFTNPTDEDRENLFLEMERGASGQYRLKY